METLHKWVYRQTFRGVLGPILVAVFCGCGSEPGGPSDQGDGWAVSADGTGIAYYVVGAPARSRTAIFVNGGPGYSHEVAFHNYLSVFEADLRWVGYDQRGVGQSDRPQSAAMYSVSLNIQDLEAVRADLGVETFILVGESWGGFLAQQYAIAHPERVDSMILVSSVPATSADDAVWVPCMTRRLRDLQSRGYIPSPAPPWTCANFHVFDPVYSYDPDFEWPELPDSFDCSDRVADLSLPWLESFDLREDLATFTKPVLMLWGEADCYAEAATNHQAAFMSAPVTAQIIPRAGHSLPLEGRDEAFTLIRSFLSLGADD